MILLGRADECAVLDGLLEDIRAGASRCLVLRGEAGIGKTALLEYVVESASGVTVARATGVESEMEMAFAGLHQLCAPMLDRLARLAPPQRHALEVVFGLSPGDPPDRFLVGLAVLSLLAEAADERPLLCVVDDAQWLDEASALTVAFVARRLGAEHVGIVFAARVPGQELRGLPELEVQGVRHGDARALLRSVVRVPLDDRVRDRIIAETRGNPLGLLELPRDLTPTQLAGGFGVPGAADLARRIEDSYVRQAEALAPDARRLLLVAAAEPVGDPLLLQRACEQLGIPLPTLAATDGLLSVTERVTFRHPLARSAMYWSADAAERRAAHRALAEVTDRDVDPDRRAWHLAAATAGPDEEVASELERSADRAAARGGLAAAAAFLQRAVSLTSDPRRRAARALAAAEVSLGAGAFEVAGGLLTTAAADPLDELGRARVELLRAQTTARQRPGGDVSLLLLNAAKNLETLDVRLCRDTYLEAWGAALYAGREASPGGSLLDVSSAAAAAPSPEDAPLATDVLLDGLVLTFTEGRSAAVPVLRRAIGAFSSKELPAAHLLRSGWLATRAANIVWDYDSCIEIADRALQLARDLGALEAVGAMGNGYGQAAALGGDIATASALAEEVRAAKDATGSHIAPLAEIALAGVRGRQPDDGRLIDDALAQTTARGQGAGAQYARWANAVLMNGLGRHEEALVTAAAGSEETPELFLSMWATIELVEAAARTQDVELANDALARLGRQTDATDSDWALGVQARSRALVSAGEAAERSYRDAIDRLGRTRLRADLARAHLVYGEWLRREQRRADARVELRAALDLFQAIGMEAFAERARGELQATGETVARRPEEPRDELTAQERQIARLARDGLTNPEIGAQLFLSRRTVEWHLHNVFVKLGIRSRRQLAAALEGDRAELTPA